MEHKHEPIVGLDSIIRCRTCGKILPSAEYEVCKVSSAIRARRVLDEIAIAGGYAATSYDRGFVVYSKTHGGVKEEVVGEKLADRNYRVFKRVSSVET